MATYYVSTSGHDTNNNGLSVEAPWKTIAKVNASTFSAGDSILFKRGDTWRERLFPKSSGASGNLITFSDYGDGLAPEITGAYPITTTGQWTDNSGAVASTWYATVNAGTVNYVLLNNLGGNNVASVAAVDSPGKWHWAANKLYVYAIQNPFTAYGVITPIILQQIVNSNGKSYLQFSNLNVNSSDAYGFLINNSTGVVIQFNTCIGNIPYGTSGNVGISLSNSVSCVVQDTDVTKWFNGIIESGTSNNNLIQNDRVYANRNQGISLIGANTTYKNNHSYGNGFGKSADLSATNRNYQGGVDGGNNIAEDIEPKISSDLFHPIFVSFSADDEGIGANNTTWMNAVVAALASRSKSMSYAVVAGSVVNNAAYIANLNTWHGSGVEISSHGWSHRYPTTGLQAVNIRYVGAGSAANMTISGGVLTTTVTGSAGDNLNINLANASYDTLAKLITYIDGLAAYTASVVAVSVGREDQAHSITLADVAAQDIKTAQYTASCDASRLMADEASTSKSWLEANITGLSLNSYLYPGSQETAALRPFVQAAGYTGGRGAILDTKSTVENGIDVFSVPSVIVVALHGLTREQIIARVKQSLFYAKMWGYCFGYYAHNNEITADEAGYLLDAILDTADVTYGTFGQQAAYIKGLINKTGNVYQDSGLQVDYHLQLTSPCIGAGTAIAGITTDIEGNQLYPPYNIGPYGAAAGALEVSPTTNRGSAKLNLTRVSGTSTTLADGDTYTLPDAHTARVALGWTYGVDHWGYNADGTPKTVLGSVIKENGDGLRWYVGAKGMALFSVDQTEKDAKIKKYLKVPA